MNLLKYIKREIFITTLTVIGVSITFLSLTYALYFTIDEKNIGQVSVAQLGFDMCIDSSCTGYGSTYGTTISGQIYPMSDAEGIAQTPYRFKMSTDSVEGVHTNIYAAVSNSEEAYYEHIRYAYRIGSGSLTYGDFSDSQIVSLYDDVYIESSDGNVIMEFYAWLDESVPNDIIGKTTSIFVNALGYYKPNDPNNLHTGDRLFANVDSSILNQEFTTSDLDYQEFTAPMTGYYYIDAYGPQYSGTNGDRVSGYIYLSKGEKLYIYIGYADNQVSTSIRYYSETPSASDLYQYDINSMPDPTDEILVASYGGGGQTAVSGEPGGAFTDPDTGDTTTKHYSGKYFINTERYEEASDGSGYVNIKYTGPLKKTTTKLNNVRYVKDCINGNSANAYNQWVEIQTMKDGENIALNKTVTGTVNQYNSTYSYSKIVDGVIISTQYGRSVSTGLRCVTIDLGSTYNLDEIAVWHVFADNRTFNNNITSVSSDNSTWVEVINKQEPETIYGKRVSAY
jgi:hypothetical protein